MKQIYETYVALGDSLTEGLGDGLVKTNRTFGGWADRLATLLSLENQLANQPFAYSNLAIRGSKTQEILGWQADWAHHYKAQLVTVLAGANDMICSGEQLEQLEVQFRSGIAKLVDSGSTVVLLNLAIPEHHWIGKPLVKYARRWSQLVNQIGSEFSLPVVDLASDTDFRHLEFWCEDLAHYSEAGHMRIANLVAEKIELTYRFRELPFAQINAPSRDLRAVVRWYRYEVIPLLIRRMRGKTSGDGLLPKFPVLERLHAIPLNRVLNVKLLQKTEQLEKFEFVSEMGLEPTPA